MYYGVICQQILKSQNDAGSSITHAGESGDAKGKSPGVMGVCPSLA